MTRINHILCQFYSDTVNKIVGGDAHIAPQGGTLNPRFHRGCFLCCNSFPFRLKTMIFFPTGKIWWNKNLKAFFYQIQKTTPMGWNGTSNPRFRRGDLRSLAKCARSAENDDIFRKKYSGTRTSKHSGTKTERPPRWGGLSVLVRGMGLEPTRRSTHAPQTCLSAYSSILANQRCYYSTCHQGCQ